MPEIQMNSQSKSIADSSVTTKIVVAVIPDLGRSTGTHVLTFDQVQKHLSDRIPRRAGAKSPRR